MHAYYISVNDPKAGITGFMTAARNVGTARKHAESVYPDAHVIVVGRMDGAR